jgi:hypothetical protein
MVWWLLLQIPKERLFGRINKVLAGYTYPEWYDDIKAELYRKAV